MESSKFHEEITGDDTFSEKYNVHVFELLNTRAISFETKQRIRNKIVANFENHSSD